MTNKLPADSGRVMQFVLVFLVVDSSNAKRHIDEPQGPQGPIGGPGPIGHIDEQPELETEMEHWDKWRKAQAHNERYFSSQNARTEGPPTETSTKTNQ